VHTFHLVLEHSHNNLPVSTPVNCYTEISVHAVIKTICCVILLYCKLFIANNRACLDDLIHKLITN